MNRKLHHTILAFSISGLAAVLMLLAASPLPSGHAPDADHLAGQPASTEALEVYARQLEIELAEAGTSAAVLTAIGTYTAAVATHGATAALQAEGRPIVDAHDEEAEAAPRRARARRQALAMPYFSFAHGLRPVRS